MNTYADACISYSEEIIRAGDKTVVPCPDSQTAAEYRIAGG